MLCNLRFLNIWIPLVLLNDELSVMIFLAPNWIHSITNKALQQLSSLPSHDILQKLTLVSRLTYSEWTASGLMDIDIRGDRTCDLPVTSLLQDELLNHKASLPLKEILLVNIAIHILSPVHFFSCLFNLIFPSILLFPGDFRVKGL